MKSDIKRFLKRGVSLLAAAELAKLRRIHQLYRGQSCYLFGDGVSLKWFDLSDFTDRPSVIAGLLPFHNDFKVLNTVMLCLLEPFWFFPGWWTSNITKSSSMPLIAGHYKRKVINVYQDTDVLLNLSNYPFIRGKNVLFTFNELDDCAFQFELSKRGLTCFNGSLNGAVSLAIYMGFSKIYLVGCDYTHGYSRSGHWYEVGQGAYSDHSGYEEPFLTVAREFCEIYTVSLESDRSLIPTVTHKQLTGRHPVYRENTALISRENLNVLGTWPYYKLS